SSSVRLWARCTGASGHRLFVHVVDKPPPCDLPWPVWLSHALLHMGTRKRGSTFCSIPHPSHLGNNPIIPSPLLQVAWSNPLKRNKKRRSPLEPAFFEAARRYELVALLISMPSNAAEPLGRHAASQCQSHSAIRT
ncbi:hypothetical protein CMEL01_00602, partial [Colletotrichum melonis]